MIEIINNHHYITFSDNRTNIRLIATFFADSQEKEYICDVKEKLYDDKAFEENTLLRLYVPLVKHPLQ